MYLLLQVGWAEILVWPKGLFKFFCNILRKNLNRPFGQPNRKTGYFDVFVQWWEDEKIEAEIQAVWGLQSQNGSFTSSKLPKHFREQYFVGKNLSVSGISQKKKKKSIENWSISHFAKEEWAWAAQWCAEQPTLSRVHASHGVGSGTSRVGLHPPLPSLSFS